MNHFTRTGAAVFEDTGQAVVALTFDHQKKRRAGAARQATEDLAPLFGVDTVRHTVVDPRWTQPEYSGLNAHKALSRDERRLDLVGTPDAVARFLTALPAALDALERQATTAARRLGTWLRSAAGQTWIDDHNRTPDGLRWLRDDFRAAAFRRLVDVAVEPTGMTRFDDRPYVDQPDAVADQVAYEALVDVQALVDEEAAQAIVDGFRVVPLDETADTDDTRDVLAAAGDVVDAAAAVLEDQAGDEPVAQLDDAELDAAAALPNGLSVSVARSAWRDWYAADCTRCTGHAVKVSPECAERADAVTAAWDHYEAHHRAADDALTLDEIDRAVALAAELSDAQYGVLWDVHLSEVLEDAQGFYTYSVHTDAPVKRSRDRIVRLMFAGYLSAHPEGDHRRTFRLTPAGDRARRLLFRAKRQGVVDLGDRDGRLGVPGAKMRRYPLLAAGHPVRCGLLPEAAPAAAVPDTVDEVLAAAGDQAPVDVVDAAVKVPVLVGAGAAVDSVAGLPSHTPGRSIQCVGYDNNRNGTPAMSRENLPKMTPAQAAAFDHLRRNGTIRNGQGFNRRALDSLKRLALAQVTEYGHGVWLAKLAAPGLAITDEARDAIAVTPADEPTGPKLTPGQKTAHQAMAANEGWAKAGDGVSRRAVAGLVDAGLATWTINVPGGHWAAYLKESTPAAAQDQVEEAPAADAEPGEVVPRGTTSGPQALACPVAEWTDVLTDAGAADQAPIPADAVDEVVPRGTTSDDAAPAAPTVEDARAVVVGYYPHAHAFEPVTDEAGAVTGWTFQVDRRPNGRYSWVTTDKTYGRATEPYRSEAAALVPVAVLDDRRAAERRTLMAAQRAARETYGDAHGWQPFTDETTGATIGWTFRHRHSGAARVGWVLTDGAVDPQADYMYRWAAETAAHAIHNPQAMAALPYRGPGYWTGAVALCGYADHRAPLRPDGKVAGHDQIREAISPCPGAFLTPRANPSEPTRRDTARIIHQDPTPDGLATSAKQGDQIVVGGVHRTVASIGPDLGMAHVVLNFVDAHPSGRRFTLDDRLTYTSRVRDHDVRCTGCGVSVVTSIDEATQGKPAHRVCGLCDHQTVVAALAAD
ncbi:hypothetical protein [Streptomyces sp. NPDC049879]|uniref:hypothetical protein n=1 Tax=Streptomyces sp. NPDC049879 TaxID=3365598 RepID=UPI0037A3579E